MSSIQLLDAADKDLRWVCAVVIVACATNANNRSVSESRCRANELREESERALLSEFLREPFEDPTPVDPVIKHAHKAAMFVKNDPVAKLITSAADPVIRYQEAVINLRNAEAEFHAAKAAMLGPIEFVPLPDSHFSVEVLDDAFGATSPINVIDSAFANM